MITEGSNAPDFCLAGLNEKGKEQEICLKDFLGRGKDIVLYFYPRNNTPGCTVEACNFRDSMSRLSRRAFVLGVSPNTVSSHKSFREKHGLNFPLLSDPDRKVTRAYGAWGEKKSFGKTTTGLIRSTLIISADGRIRQTWTNVKVSGHVEEVLQALKSGYRQ